MCSELGSLKFGTSEYTMQNLRRNYHYGEVLELFVNFSALLLKEGLFHTSHHQVLIQSPLLQKGSLGFKRPC